MFPGVSPIRAALLSAAFLFSTLSGCGTAGSFRSAREIVAWVGDQGFSVTVVQVGKFSLAAFAREPTTSEETLAIYIEGDGAAWPTPYHPPRDPTPTRPVALNMSVSDPSAAVVYLGRPCQYLDEEALKDCDGVYWTERRFAPEVVAAYDDAISRQKSAFGARQVRLVGYSGGGVLAALLAARRDDIDMLITVAAPLALAEWVAWHKLSALNGSLDPAELSDNARLPRSIHFAGGRDEIVPPAIVGSFVRRKGGRMETVPDFDHECCWVREWAKLLGRIMIEEAAK